MKILVTGANGFIGTHLCAILKQHGHELLECARNPTKPHHIKTGDIIDYANWAELMQGVDCIIHLAAMVHHTNIDNNDATIEQAFERANVVATQKLLQAAKVAGVAHFVFFSTIAVMGYDMGYDCDAPLPATHHAPYSPYSRSKLAAEILVQQSGLPHSIIRIPLTYGLGVRANFQTLIKAVKKGLPLPFALVKNARSLLYVGNLASGVVRLLEMENKPEMLLLCDAHAPSTPELIREIAKALNQRAFNEYNFNENILSANSSIKIKPRLIPVPLILLKIGAVAMRKPMLYHQLCSSLVMDCTITYKELNWQPPFSLQQGLALTVE